MLLTHIHDSNFQSYGLFSISFFFLPFFRFFFLGGGVHIAGTWCFTCCSSVCGTQERLKHNANLLLPACAQQQQRINEREKRI